MSDGILKRREAKRCRETVKEYLRKMRGQVFQVRYKHEEIVFIKGRDVALMRI